jgi:hypothetical protein
VFCLHAHAGAGHAREARQLHTRLFSRDFTLHGEYLQAAKKIDAGYFIPGSEELKTPAQKEFDEIFSAEVDMLLAV